MKKEKKNNPSTKDIRKKKIITVRKVGRTVENGKEGKRSGIATERGFIVRLTVVFIIYDVQYSLFYLLRFV